MRKILFALSVLVLMSCTPPVDETPPPNVRVYNSAWQVVAEERVGEARAVDVPLTLEELVADYNAAHTEDQLFLVEGEALVPIELAPPVNAWFVDEDTYEVIEEYLMVPRREIIENREAWRMQVANLGHCVLFIDRIPPPPEPPRPVTDFELYAIYLIDEAGAIIAEEHCEAWAEWGYASREAMFVALSTLWRTELGSHPGWQLVTRTLYEVPVVVVPTVETPAEPV